MTKTIAIVGPARGWGWAWPAPSVATVIARNRDRLEKLAGELAERGITAAAFPADIRDRDALAAALASAGDVLGPVEVVKAVDIRSSRAINAQSCNGFQRTTCLST
ncbi:hypothetical protein [Nocardia anaemiae]|uniref:hypothetical protein n=1 Tax=Nocardia anaemiae TaxID=263910 RepID=UPI0007A448F3|nr:hypothetical protein [Nocardia anaemiae]